jgi:hypothetical protein
VIDNPWQIAVDRSKKAGLGKMERIEYITGRKAHQFMYKSIG